MIFRRAFFIAALFFGAFFWSAWPGQAFTIQPLRYRVTIDPGRSTTVRVTVLNDETMPRRFRASVAGVEQDDAGRPLFGTSFDIAEEWVKPDINTFFLGPGEKKAVTFTVSAPPRADPGSHFLALIIESSSAKTGAVGLTARVAALLSLAVSGVVEETVSIDRFASVARLSASGEWPLEAVLKNRGTVSVKPDGALIVKNALGQIVAGQPVSFGVSLLPQAVRMVAPKIELDRAKVRLPGWYTVNLAVHYGLSKSVVEAQATVWYFPPWFIVAIGISLTGILFLLLLKKYHSKKQV
ncbi:MAG: hypothetical protein HY983_01995 [Candidatus Magasanikbacteria bacterium]|nr:hypothetical protein [Candidatus Magasanikbacteria bacterium]